MTTFTLLAPRQIYHEGDTASAVRYKFVFPYKNINFGLEKSSGLRSKSHYLEKLSVFISLLERCRPNLNIFVLFKVKKVLKKRRKKYCLSVTFPLIFKKRISFFFSFAENVLFRINK